MYFKKSILLTFFVFPLLLAAQNIVQNGSFETITKKPKNPGEIFLAPPWVPATQHAPDLYSRSAKSDEIKTPNNTYGDEKPREGDNYAGILIYSNGEKEGRTYLTQKLKYQMLAGEHYCVKMHVSFADMSKYASNGLGIYVSHDSVGSETDLILGFKPQVINSTDRIFEQQWDWEDICRIYVADGGEQYITIGNFTPQAEVKTKSVRRPKGYTATQKRNGYYYIDDISITPNATRTNCKCEPGNFQFAHLDKQAQSFETAEEDIPDKVIISTTGEVHGQPAVEAKVKDDIVIPFALGKSDLKTAGVAGCDEAVAFLKENTGAKITLVSHSDASESVIKGLSTKRMSQVNKYLVSKGIESSRITQKDVGDKEPLDTSGKKENRDKNMVVEIKFSN